MVGEEINEIKKKLAEKEEKLREIWEEIRTEKESPNNPPSNQQDQSTEPTTNNPTNNNSEKPDSPTQQQPTVDNQDSINDKNNITEVQISQNQISQLLQKHNLKTSDLPQKYHN